MTSPVASDTRLHPTCRQPLNIPDPVETIPAPPRPGRQLPPLRPLPDSRILDLRARQDLRDTGRPRTRQQRLTSFREQALPGFADLLDRTALPASRRLLIWIAHEKISIALTARADVDKTLPTGEARRSRRATEYSTSSAHCSASDHLRSLSSCRSNTRATIHQSPGLTQ